MPNMPSNRDHARFEQLPEEQLTLSDLSIDDDGDFNGQRNQPDWSSRVLLSTAALVAIGIAAWAAVSGPAPAPVPVPVPPQHGTAPAPDNQADLQESIRKAIELRQASQLSEAADELRTALAKVPDADDSWLTVKVAARRLLITTLLEMADREPGVQSVTAISFHREAADECIAAMKEYGALGDGTAVDTVFKRAGKDLESVRATVRNRHIYANDPDKKVCREYAMLLDTLIELHREHWLITHDSDSLAQCLAICRRLVSFSEKAFGQEDLFASRSRSKCAELERQYGTPGTEVVATP